MARGVVCSVHLEVRKKLDEYDCAGRLTLAPTEPSEYFTYPAAFTGRHPGKNN